jgi:transcriptional regulator with XRE-family HTH domain
MAAKTLGLVGDLADARHGIRCIDWEEYRPYSRAEIGKRLALLRRALGYTTTKMCKLMGSSSGGSTWTDYEMGRRRISIHYAIQLKKAIPDLSLDWIYRDRLDAVGEELWKKITRAQISSSASLCFDEGSAKRWRSRGVTRRRYG